MTPSAPPSYATADKARAYVARVSACRRPVSGRRPRLYLIAAPGQDRGTGWARMLKTVAGRFPGAEFVTYADLFGEGSGRGGADVTERVPAIAAETDGAVVMARRWVNNFGEGVPGHGAARYLMGYAAKLEADALAELGVPVLLVVPSGAVVTWPDVRPHFAERAPAWVRIEVDMPAPDPSRILPTTAVAYRALGITPPPPRRPRLAAEARHRK